ncbi:MAG: DNA-formamidopyrimidine glycosylase [Solobacterium sp.]|nr:DNA-formamidopyrimidine glycosylase [Solobacterium sp.]
MPELPEVETVLRTLEQRIAGLQIMDVQVLYDKLIEGDSQEFCRILKGQTFRRFCRRGKYLLFGMDDVWFVSHLRMEGKYFIQRPEEPLIKHTHAVFTLSDGNTLRYHDVRKFGRMKLYPGDTDFTDFHGLGPEPFSEEFSTAYAVEQLQKRREPIKSVLLDQSFAAGIGNIYADEILAAAHILPMRRACDLEEYEIGRIVEQAGIVLKQAVEAGGTTIRSYTSSLGVTGLFQLQCLVHARKTCAVCGGEVRRIRLGGRSSYYCEHCQR